MSEIPPRMERRGVSWSVDRKSQECTWVLHYGGNRQARILFRVDDPIAGGGPNEQARLEFRGIQNALRIVGS